MDLWQIKIFTKVVETKSFSKASEEIHLSQPTVSSHIKELEAYFNCRLIDRLGKESVPTRAGQILYEYATKLLDLENQTKEAIYDFLGKIKGTLHIGGSTIPSSYIIPKLIGPFKQRFDEISIAVSAGDTSQVTGDILSGKIEIGIVGAAVDHPQLTQEKLLKDEMRLIVPKDHDWAGRNEIDIKMLLGQSFIAREEGSGTWSTISRALEEAGVGMEDLNISVTFGNTASVIQGILNQVGVSILSSMAVEDHVAFGHLSSLTVRGLDLTRHFYLTYHSRREQSPVCREFINHAHQFIK
ncbi:MAG: LysR family transcriptional regulator [Desulfobacteraceae bacterium]|nr:MAG: LysR family transcriptional regulator [Desulfobacteraceae bacterium]